MTELPGAVADSMGEHGSERGMALAIAALRGLSQRLTFAGGCCALAQTAG
jgi:hypothetical protein